MATPATRPAGEAAEVNRGLSSSRPLVGIEPPWQNECRGSSSRGTILLEQFPFDVNRFGHRGFPWGRKSVSDSASTARENTMAKGYAEDLRVRVVALVEAGESRREAARLLDVGASSAIRWLERWTTTGSVAAKPGTGHCRSPLEAHKQWLLDLVAAEPDLTLDEIRVRLAREMKLKAGRSSVGRFFDRHGVSFKKNSARRRTGSA